VSHFCFSCVEDGAADIRRTDQSRSDLGSTTGRFGFVFVRTGSPWLFSLATRLVLGTVYCSSSLLVFGDF